MKLPEMGQGTLKTPEKMRTVRDIKNYFEAKFGRGGNWSDEQRALWEKLNKLGARNIREIPPETVPDIDATVELSDKEIHELKIEIDRLEK